MTLLEQISRIQNLIATGNFPNESSISQGIVLPILSELGWDIYDSAGTVVPEYSVSGRRVDFALLDRRKRPVVFIEVKMMGNIESAEEQLFTYAYHQGVPFLVLTDGKEWNFFLPQGVGSYQDRKLYKLDLLDRNIEIINEKLFRYLGYKDVISGIALDNAKDDFRRIAKSREAEQTIPEAWKALIQARDELLLDLLSDKVESICGFKPNKKDCINFLENYYSFTEKIESKTKVENKNKKSIIEMFDPLQVDDYSIYVVLNGKKHPETSARGVLSRVLKYLAQRNPTFLIRFERVARGRTRNYISQDKMNIYPNRPDLAKYTKEFVPGWWVAENLGKKRINDILMNALKTANIQKGGEIDYSLGK